MPVVNGIAAPELIIIVVIVMIIFRVGRLPEVGGAIGKAPGECHKSQGLPRRVAKSTRRPRTRKRRAPLRMLGAPD